MSISGRAKLAGVMGDPVGHSLSPRIHAHWLRIYGIDGAYVPLPVAKDAFSAAVRGVMAAGFVGLNVTVPHKEAAFTLTVAATSGCAITLEKHDLPGRSWISRSLKASITYFFL